MTANALLEALNILYSREEFLEAAVGFGMENEARA